MKKQVLTLLLCVGAMLAFNANSNAQSTLIHYWHFNNYSAGAMYTPTISSIPADYSDLASSNARIVYQKQAGTSAVYSSYVDAAASTTADGDTINLRQGAVSGMWLRTRNPSDSMELRVYTPTTHFKNISFKFTCERSNNGMLHQNYDYSLDSGATWSTTGLSLTTDSMYTFFKLITLTCTDTNINNNSKVIFRINWNHADNQDTGTSGNNRFDNVSVDGDTIIASTTAVNQVVTAPVSYSLYPNPVVNNIEINADADGAKSVMILNATGQSVYVGLDEGKHFSVSTANLSKGNYYISIREMSTGKVSTMKFVKL